MTRQISFRGATLAAAMLFVFGAILPAAAQSPGGNTIGGQFVALFQPEDARAGLGIGLTAHVTGGLSLDANLNVLPFQNSSGGGSAVIGLALGPRFRVFSRRRWAIYVGLLPWLFTSTESGSEASWFIEPEGTVAYRLPHRWLWRTSFGYMGNENYGNFTGFFQVTSGLAYRF